MTDDKSKRGPADRSRINRNEEYEVQWWTGELGCTRRQLLDCIDKVGPMVVDVRRCLKQKS